MAIGREWRETITDALWAPATMMTSAERRLGEADLLPRGPRGVNAPHYEWVHGARLLFGGMAALADAGFPTSRVARRVAQIGRMRPVGARAEAVVPGAAPFEAAVAHVLKALAYTESADRIRENVREIALVWERDALFGLIRLDKARFKTIVEGELVYEPLDNPPNAYRAHFLEPPVLTREARLSSHALFRLVARINAYDKARLAGRALSETDHPGATPGGNTQLRAEDAAPAPSAQQLPGPSRPNHDQHQEGETWKGTTCRTRRVA